MKKSTKRKPHWQKQYDALVLAGTAKTTRRAYVRDTQYFLAWAKLALKGKQTLPFNDEAIVIFILQHLQGLPSKIEKALTKNKRKRPGVLKTSTIKRYLSSISIWHQEAGFDSPTTSQRVRLLMKRARRAKAEASPMRKAAITIDVLKKLTATCDNSLHGLRDKALLLVGFASGGRRRDELAHLLIEDLTTIKGGYLIRLRKSKTDQAGRGETLPILGPAATALKKWLMKSGLRKGRLFRGIKSNGDFYEGIDGRTINRIVKRCATKAVLDSKKFGAHSLRAGFVTESGRQGASLRDAMQLSGHRTVEIAGLYHREGELLKNPTARLLSHKIS